MRTERHTPAAPHRRLTVTGTGTAKPLLLPGFLAGSGDFTLALRVSRALVLMSLMGDDSLMDRLSALIRNSELFAEGHFAKLLPFAIFKR
jgi:hypothetical protein